MIKNLLLWPYKPGNDFAPWFVVLWRIPFAGLFYLGASISFVACFAGYGKKIAIQFWENL